MRLRILAGLAVAMALLYLGDALLFRFRPDPLGSVLVERYDAIPEKNGKTEFALEEPIHQACVHALFPHRGYPTCWYLSRHSEQRVDF